jgi:hypothetical protein
MMGQILKELVEEKGEVTPWMEEGTWNLLTQIGSHGVLWIPRIANVFSLSSGDNHGGYGVVCKVRIKIFNHIPSTIKLAGKSPKMDDNQ